MNDLLQISTTIIGSEQVNSINARKVHEHLEVRTHFTTWIKRAIDKYDFEENIDFSILESGNPGGGISIKDYIVTLDMAKELSMLENNPRGKATRKYFIAAEKAKPKTQIELIIESAQQIQLIQDVQDSQTKRLEILEDTKVITSRQRHALKLAVSQRVFQLKEDHKLNDSWTKKGYQRIWKKLKDIYVVSTYMDIPGVKFGESMSIVSSVSFEEIC